MGNRRLIVHERSVSKRSAASVTDNYGFRIASSTASNLSRILQGDVMIAYPQPASRILFRHPSTPFVDLVEQVVRSERWRQPNLSILLTP
jgi:hypothetical protein